MSYTPIGWQTGDTITAEKLNKMDNGWGVSSTQIFSETVTTTDTGEGFASGSLVYVFQSEPPQTAVITFDGVTYICNRDSNYGYGETGESGPDFTNYPFYIQSTQQSTEIYTSTAGDYSVAFGTENIEASAAFGSAVKSCSPLFLCVAGVTTYDEMAAATSSGSLLYFYSVSDSKCHFIVSYLDSASPTAVSALPAGVSNVETYGFNNNMVFTIYNY